MQSAIRRGALDKQDGEGIRIGAYNTQRRMANESQQWKLDMIKLATSPFRSLECGIQRD